MVQATGAVPDAREARQGPEAYAGTVFQSLAVFRFFVFAMGAGLAFALQPSHAPTSLQVLVAALVGLYNIGRVVWRTDLARRRPLVDTAALGTDLLLALTLVLLTGGLDSAFLIYSLAPVLSAALLMDLRAAATAGSILALSLSGAHVAGKVGLGHFPWILSGNYLAFLLLYAAICLLSAFLPFLTNLNWHSRVRSLATLSEQQRLRREVHDNVAQTLAFLSLKMKRAEERASDPGSRFTGRDVDDIARAIERSYVSVRDYLDGAAAGVGEGLLGARLSAAAAKWSRETGLPVRVRANRRDRGLSPEVTSQMVQIAREALANVSKHASPAHVWVELEYALEGATLRVRDDGIGFLPSQPRGHGLNIMQERAALIGASLTISSAPERGTEVVVVYPYGGKGEAE